MESNSHWNEELQAALELLAQGRPEDCTAKLRTLLRTCENSPLCRGMILEGMGRALFAQRQGAEALAALEESLSLLRVGAGPSSPLTLGVMQNLAYLRLELGDIEGSAALGQEAVRGCEAAFGTRSARVASALLHLSAAYYRKKDWDAAEERLMLARGIWEELARATGVPDQQMGTCLNNLGRLYEERGLPEQGIALHRQAVALRQSVLGDHEDTAFSLGNLGVALASAGQWDEAASTLEAAVACYARLGKSAGPEAESYRKNLDLCRRVLAEQAGRAAPAQDPEQTAEEPDDRTALLAEIIERELVMFLATPNEGGPASCQQRPDSFRLMRRMAHEPLSRATLASYLEDLRRAEVAGRNFMIEKYARMDKRLPPLGDSPLLDDIAEAEAVFMREASARYPHVIVSEGSETFRNYLRCELETLSFATLELYAQDLERARREGRNTAVERYSCLARVLGKGSLDDFEKSSRAAVGR